MKNRFSRGDHFRFPIGTILAIFDLQVTPMLPSKFQVNLSFGSGGEAKIDFQDGNCGGHLGIPIETILAFFNQQVTPMLPTQFQVNWPFGLGGEGKNRFSRWRPRWPPLILDRELFELFLIHKSPQCFLPSQLAFRKKLKIEFQDGHHSSTLVCLC